MAQTMQNKPLAKKETAPAVKVNDLRAPKMATQAKSSPATAAKSQAKSVSQVQAFKTAIAAKNSPKVLSSAKSMTDAERKSVAENSTTMNALLAMKTDYYVKASMDLLYTHVNDDAVMQSFVEKRYGVKLGSKTIRGTIFKLLCCTSDTEQAWTVNGARHLYYSLGLLPPSHVDKVCSITTMNTSSGGGGVALDWTGSYNVNYTDSNTKAIAGNGYCESKNDYKYSLNSLDCTMVHELGHIVDGNAGWKISGPGSSMRNVSKWEETPDVPSRVVDEMIKSIAGSPYDGTLTDAELKIAKDVGIAYLAQDQKSYAGKWGSAVTALTDLVESAVEKSADASIDADALVDKLTNKTCDTNLLYHLWRAQGANSSHYNHNDAMRGMNRPFHQGYAGQPWFTFDLSAWNDKISCYQFRCPKEEFAETYASYHAAPAMGKKKGEMTPKGLLDWFVGEGYGEVIPESGSSEVEEEKSTKS